MHLVTQKERVFIMHSIHLFLDYKIKENIDQVTRDEIAVYQKQQQKKIPTLVRRISLKMTRLPSFRQSVRVSKYTWATLSVTVY